MRLAPLPTIAPTLTALSILSSLNSASYANGAYGLDLAARFQLAGRGELEVAQSFDGDAAGVNAAGYLLAIARLPAPERPRRGSTSPRSRSS